MRTRDLSAGRLALLLLTACFTLTLTGCGGGCDDGCNPGPINPPPAGATLVPDFALLDVNPNSASTNTFVSPRHYVGRISAYYFGSAT